MFSRIKSFHSSATMSLVSGYIRNPYHQSPDDFSLLYRHHPHPPSMFAAAAAHHPSNDAMLGDTSAAGAYFQTWMLQQQQRSHSPSTGSNSCSLTPEYPSVQDQRYSRFLHGSSDVTSDLYSHPGSFVDYAGFSNMLSAVGHASDGTVPVRVRCVKRRSSANKKERRRTHSINSAFSALRGCIPNVPPDTKLSKIKTLRLATSYISYMMEVLSNDDPKMQLDAPQWGIQG